MTRKATTTTADPELSTPLGNEPAPKNGAKKNSSGSEKTDTEDQPVHEPLEVELLEGRQESGREGVKPMFSNGERDEGKLLVWNQQASSGRCSRPRHLETRAMPLSESH